MIVVAYTPDAYGEAALEAGVAEAKLRGLGLVAVNATRGDAYVDDRFASSEQIEEVRAQLAAAGLSADVRQAVGAEPAGAVLDVADEVGATVLVVGLRPRTPVGKVLMGSVAQRLLLDASCWVLAVKPRSRR